MAIYIPAFWSCFGFAFGFFIFLVWRWLRTSYLLICDLFVPTTRLYFGFIVHKEVYYLPPPYAPRATSI